MTSALTREHHHRVVGWHGNDLAHGEATYRLHVFAGDAHGTARAGDDAAALGWYSLAEMARMPVTATTREIAAEIADGAQDPQTVS